MGYLNVAEQLTILHSLPEKILELNAEELHTVLDGPTLIHLKGKHESVIFISVLLHGNEHTSWQALRILLKEFQHQQLPRCLSIFIGNVEAAKHNVRHLEGSEDFNRNWGSKSSPAHPIMQKVVEEMHERKVKLSLDIHNNTGKNPHYACVNKLEPEFLYLASLFSQDVVYFLKPEGVQSMAFAELCPAVTLECGLSGETSGTDHALEFLRVCLHLSEFPNKAPAKDKLRVYHTVAIVKINSDYSFTFDIDLEKQTFDIVLKASIENTNFTELHPGATLGTIAEGVNHPLQAQGEEGVDLSKEYFEIRDRTIYLKRKVIPAMFTLNKDNITKDCLCYFMERIEL